MRHRAPAFCIVSLLVAVAMTSASCRQPAHGGSPGLPPEGLSVAISGCQRDPLSGGLIVDVSMTGSGTLNYEIDAATDQQVMAVEGVFADGTRRLGWSTVSSGVSNVMTLNLGTAEIPSAVSIDHLTFGALAPAATTAPSFESLEGSEVTVGPWNVTVASVGVYPDAVGVDLRLMPLVFSDDLILMATDEPKLHMPGTTFEGAISSSPIPPGDFAIEQMIFPLADGEPLTSDAGPAEFSIEGIVLQHIGVIDLDMPVRCG